MRLKELRTQRGDLQRHVAKELNCATSTYSHYEKGTREPDISTLKALSKYFDVSIDYIVCND